MFSIWSIFAAIGNILWPFGIFCGSLVYFSRFGILDREKSGNPGGNRETPSWHSGQEKNWRKLMLLLLPKSEALP
jgi:hypothetical protein